ncbi:hypothetical protein [Trueperella pyogenes]|uniref:hypothetical protein n=1 Tax=Trueperella pyogenes TaxID=1661 RepID=UPI0011C078F6|nr:hypothetical protein [Trueperella pyogenes]MBB3024455.1 uncharacterized protein YqgC (DUF456 family) [Trueperella pyogenes]WHU56534.1 hypothetical protein QEV10_07225 [Trueperella pyogenes]
MNTQPQRVYWTGMVVGLLSIFFFVLIIPQIAALSICRDELRKNPEVKWPSILGIVASSIASLVVALILLRVLSIIVWPVD